MKIQILGAHNLESANTRPVSLLVDDILALDAGSLTSSLTFEAQQQIKAILLTHHHFDHIRDIATIGLAAYSWGKVEVCGSKTTLDALSRYIMNGDVYLNFTERHPGRGPSREFRPLEPYVAETIQQYQILAIPVHHAVPAVGYQITAPDGKRLFYTGDTGPGCSYRREHASPDLIITEVTMPNMYEDEIREAGHLSPRLLGAELLQFQRIKGYLPPVLLVHMNPEVEGQIKVEVEAVARELGTTITLAYEGMTIQL